MFSSLLQRLAKLDYYLLFFAAAEAVVLSVCRSSVRFHSEFVCTLKNRHRHEYITCGE